MGKITVLWGDTQLGGNSSTAYGTPSAVEEFFIPETVTSIGRYAFISLVNLNFIVCNPTIPPTLNSNAALNSSNCPIYVPDASVEAYKTATNWSTYADRIYPMSIYEIGGLNEIITFEDPAVEAVCLAKWDNNDDGYFTKTEAASVTSLGTTFQGNTEIEYFDEFEDFTGIKDFNNHAGHGGEFQNCTNLKSLVLPQTITSLNFACFQNTPNLKNLVLPQSLKSIGNRVFIGCGMENDVVLPNLETIGGTEGSSFINSKIKRIVNLGKITTINNGSPGAGNGVFKSCVNLESVVLPDTLLTIGSVAFQGCTSLNEINIPNSVTNIGQNAFYECTNLEIKDLQLSNLETLGQNAFCGVKIKKISNLGKLTTLPTASNTTQNFGDKNVLEEVILPNGVTTIPDSCFYGYTMLHNCNLTHVTSISRYAFRNCSALAIEVNCPNLTGTLPYGTFTNSGVTKVTNLGSITEITSYDNSVGAFGGCKNLTHVTLPNTLTTLGSYTFYNCTALKIEDLSLPNLTSLGQNVFYGVKIKRISNLGNITALPMATTSTQNFGDTSVLEEVVLPNEVISIPDYSFRNYINLSKVTLPNQLQSVGQASFAYTNFEEFIFPDSIRTIGNSCLYGCSNMRKIIIGTNIASIGNQLCEVPNGSKMEFVVVKATTPPSVTSSSFAYMNLCPIYVPDGSVEQEVDNGDGTTSTVTKTIVELYKEASGWSNYADRIRPLSEYDVRIITYNEDGNGGYNLYQVANYDTSKNDYVMGVAVRNSEHAFVVAKQSTKSASWGWYTTLYSDKTSYDGRGNTNAMLENGNSGGVAHKANEYIFSNGTTGYIGSYAECEMILEHRDVINEALTKSGGVAISGEHYTSTSYNNNNAYAHVLIDSGMGGQDKSVARACRPLTELPEGLEW